MSGDEMPTVFTALAGYAQSKLYELTAFVREGRGVARIVHLKTGQVVWIVPDAPPGVVEDATPARTRRDRVRAAARNRWPDRRREAAV